VERGDLSPFRRVGADRRLARRCERGFDEGNHIGADAIAMWNAVTFVHVAPWAPVGASQGGASASHPLYETQGLGRHGRLGATREVEYAFCG
jgi:hypothetical protein